MGVPHKAITACKKEVLCPRPNRFYHNTQPVVSESFKVYLKLHNVRVMQRIFSVTNQCTHDYFNFTLNLIKI